MYSALEYFHSNLSPTLLSAPLAFSVVLKKEGNVLFSEQALSHFEDFQCGAKAYVLYDKNIKSSSEM